MPKIIENLYETILNHGRNIVITEGHQKLTMRNISKKSGIAVGTLYNYFPTKRELTIQLIEDYWREYSEAVEEIKSKEEDLFVKLKLIYEKLVYFVDTFMDVWIKDITSDFDEDSLCRKNNFMEKLYDQLEGILIEEAAKNTITLFLEPKEISRFLIQNLFMMSQMKQYEYSSFEKIVRKLLQ